MARGSTWGGFSCADSKLASLRYRSWWSRPQSEQRQSPTHLRGAATKDTTPIIVGGDGDLSISAGVTQGFEAGIYRFNKAGGLDGRKIVYTGFLDDAFSPATNLSNAQELVNSKHVFAIAPFVGQSAGAATGSFLAENKIPFLGWSTNAAYEVEPKWGFGINGNQGNPAVQGAGGMLQAIAQQGDQKNPGKIKMALIANDLAGAAIANKSLAGVASAEGIDVVYQKAAIAAVGTTNYAPYAQAMMSAGANTVYEVLGAADSIGLAAALHAAGFKGMIINGVTYYQGDMAAQGASTVSALQGVYVEDEFPANQNNTPAVLQGEKDLKAIGQNPGMTSGTAVGYWTAIVFEQMLKATLKAEGGNPGQGDRRDPAANGGGRQELGLHRPDHGRHRDRDIPGGRDPSDRLRHPAQDGRDELQAGSALQVLLRHQRIDRQASESADREDGSQITDPFRPGRMTNTHRARIRHLTVSVSGARARQEARRLCGSSTNFLATPESKSRVPLRCVAEAYDGCVHRFGDVGTIVQNRLHEPTVVAHHRTLAGGEGQ